MSIGGNCGLFLFRNPLSATKQSTCQTDSLHTSLDSVARSGADMAPTVVRTDQEWRSMLSREEYEVLRQADTQRPFTGEYVEEFSDGIYVLSGCQSPLFDSESKFESNAGWPTFYGADSRRRR